MSLRSSRYGANWSIWLDGNNRWRLCGGMACLLRGSFTPRQLEHDPLMLPTICHLPAQPVTAADVSWEPNRKSNVACHDGTVEALPIADISIPRSAPNPAKGRRPLELRN